MKKNQLISIRVSEEEHKLLEAICAKEGKSKSKLLLDSTLKKSWTGDCLLRQRLSSLLCELGHRLDTENAVDEFALRSWMVEVWQLLK